MAKYNITGQIAALSQQEAVNAKASNAVTDAGYLGGNSWLKSQLDASKQLLKDDPTEIPGYEFLSFSSAKEGLVIPDGAFDFFDLTYDLSQKNVQECLIQFAYPMYGASTSAKVNGFKAAKEIDFMSLTNFNKVLNSTTDSQAPFTSGNPEMANGNPIWIVTTDYKECGFGGVVTSGGGVATGIQVGYKLSGQNPPTDDSGFLYQIKSGFLSSYAHAFTQYKDATDTLTGMRYMVGMYDTGSVLTYSSGDDFVLKSMSIKVTSAGVNQFVLHCRKAKATTNHTINLSDICKGIHILKINY